jgi:hypothetical protein
VIAAPQFARGNPAAVFALNAAMGETSTRDLTLTARADEPMTAEQAYLLKRLAQEAYDTEAYGPHLTQTEAARRIAALQEKIKLQGNPPHPQ